ncbi:MAG TPA: hypothetical protein VE264_02105 [Nitrososphaera sp.]|jgi:hypothetical protein|nr:hypothetical protein [Nitrososphaera sp.]
MSVLAMTIYVVKAKPKEEIIADLRQELSSGKISRLRPFGEELHHSLENARMFDGYAYWVEEDYCSPPLAMERRSVLDRYFDDIIVEQVESDEEGWNRIKDRPMLWK